MRARLNLDLQLTPTCTDTYEGDDAQTMNRLRTHVLFYTFAYNKIDREEKKKKRKHATSAEQTKQTHACMYI